MTVSFGYPIDHMDGRQFDQTAPREGACMVWSSVRICAVLELLVMVFQVGGIAALCVYRFLPATRWAGRGRVGYIIALVGLGVAGALCGRHDSEFALFAGGTMTLLLIGMTVGNGQHDTTGKSHGLAVVEPNLAG
jgi:hypothetical protein